MISGAVEDVGGALVRRERKQRIQDLTGSLNSDPLSALPELTRESTLAHLRSMIRGAMIMPEISGEGLQFTANCNMPDLVAQLRLIIETDEASIASSDIARVHAIFDDFNPLSRDIHAIERGLRRLSLAYDLGLSGIDWEITHLMRYDHTLVPAAPRVELHKVSLQPATERSGLPRPLNDRVVLERIAVAGVIGIFKTDSTAEVQFRLDSESGRSVSPVTAQRTDELSLSPEFHLFFIENGERASRHIRNRGQDAFTALYRRYDDGWRLWSVR